MSVGENSRSSSPAPVWYESREAAPPEPEDIGLRPSADEKLPLSLDTLTRPLQNNRKQIQIFDSHNPDGQTIYKDQAADSLLRLELGLGRFRELVAAAERRTSSVINATSRSVEANSDREPAGLPMSSATCLLLLALPFLLYYGLRSRRKFHS